MPGDSLQIIDNRIYIDGAVLPDTKNVQHVYYVETDVTIIKDDLFRRLRVSVEDRHLASERTSNFYKMLSYLGFMKNADGRYNSIYRIPLTTAAMEMVKKMPSVRKFVIEPEQLGGDVYPIDYDMGWTRDNYGPIWIPQKGATIELNEKNLALYHRCIRNYEDNTLEVAPD